MLDTCIQININATAVSVGMLGLMKNFVHLFAAVLAVANLAGCSTTPSVSNCSGLPNRAAQKLINKGFKCEGSGDWTGALQWLAKAVEADPSNGQVYWHRGEIYARLGQQELCVSDYNRMVELAPKCDLFYWVRGNYLMSSGRICDGLIDYAKCCAFSPNPHYYEMEFSCGVYTNCGIANLSPADYDKAIGSLTALAQENVSASSPYVFRGLVCLAKSDYGHAIADFDAALTRDKTLIAPLYFRAKTLDLTGHTKDALFGYSEFVRRVAQENESNQRASTKANLRNLSEWTIPYGLVGTTILWRPSQPFRLPALQDMDDTAKKRILELSALSR